MTSDRDSTSRVIVVGGGYAGVMAANRLTQRDDVTVTLINPRAQFVERIRLHQLAAQTHPAVHDMREVLAPDVELVVGSVELIDTASRTVAVGGDILDYDYLVYAVGSHSSDVDVPGVREHAYPVSTLEQAQRLRAALADTPESAPVTVVGAGPTGIETAAELADAGRAVTLVCGRVLGPYLHPRIRRGIAKRLRRMGVTIVDGAGATVTAVAADSVDLADGNQITSALTIWAAGFAVPELALRSGLSTDEAGRLLTDETLTSVDDDHIVAAGDCAAPSALPYRMSCQAANQLGPQAADTVLRRIDGEEPGPALVGFAGQCISLGRRYGTFQFSRRNDVAVPLHVGGRVGARLKELVCKSTVDGLRHEADKPGRRLVRMRDPHRDAALAERNSASTLQAAR
ncbi:NAD(P)/FAD-dependent oxidoreductase [Jongsikchunia kroppenstedtii]|uniref:NAD(P)/FAD-dependent oxidoreductase n=1 Tax=Jongsikchunia kroppenstedtii TaxID=1121721 RepID=UPI00036762DA|nr:FAD-dependent oxidoreductase [Jongsikchunia kroppenstedtii]